MHARQAPLVDIRVTKIHGLGIAIIKVGSRGCSRRVSSPITIHHDAACVATEHTVAFAKLALEFNFGGSDWGGTAPAISWYPPVTGDLLRHDRFARGYGDDLRRTAWLRSAWRPVAHQ